jgi:hypothetical protein
MAGDDIPRFDRDYLLGPAKRNQIIELWEVEKFGRDSFGDPDAVSLYGMAPSQWYERGIRILARTTLEAVRDPLGNQIGQDVARVVGTAALGSGFGVIDPFAGSCNGLYPLTRGRIMRAREGGEFERETWPDQVERWPLTKLIPYARNARTHSDEQVAQIAASIREWGWTVPVLVDEQGTLIAGMGEC